MIFAFVLGFALGLPALAIVRGLQVALHDDAAVRGVGPLREIDSADLAGAMRRRR
jgi:hypothetical protein